MPRKTSELEAKEKLDIIMAALDDKKAVDPEILDVVGKTLIADYFVITHGTSGVHIRALTEGVQEAMLEKGGQKARQEGVQEGSWMLLDYGDVVVHVFTEEARDLYSLDTLWLSTQSAREQAGTYTEAETTQEP